MTQYLNNNETKLSIIIFDSSPINICAQEDSRDAQLIQFGWKSLYCNVGGRPRPDLQKLRQYSRHIYLESSLSLLAKKALS